MSRNMIRFEDVHGGHRWRAWVDPEHVIAVVEDQAGTVLHLSNGRTLIVLDSADDAADRVLGIAEEEEGHSDPIFSEAAAARAWARENGIEVKPVGLLPKAVLEGYRNHLLETEA